MVRGQGFRIFHTIAYSDPASRIDARLKEWLDAELCFTGDDLEIAIKPQADLRPLNHEAAAIVPVFALPSA